MIIILHCLHVMNSAYQQTSPELRVYKARVLRKLMTIKSVFFVLSASPFGFSRFKFKSINDVGRVCDVDERSSVCLK